MGEIACNFITIVTLIIWVHWDHRWEIRGTGLEFFLGSNLISKFPLSGYIRWRGGVAHLFPSLEDNLFPPQLVFFLPLRTPVPISSSSSFAISLTFTHMLHEMLMDGLCLFYVVVNWGVWFIFLLLLFLF